MPPIQQLPTRSASPATLPESWFGKSFTRAVTFQRLEGVSLFHSVVYVSLLVCAFGLGDPEPVTFILGLAHGLLWIGMSITSLLALRFRIIDLRLTVAIVLLGCVAPFFGSIEFIRQSRRKMAAA